MPAVGAGAGSLETGLETCATIFPRRVLYNRGTPGIVRRSQPTVSGCVAFGDMLIPARIALPPL